MSAYITLSTPMLDRQCLIAAIEDEGVRRTELVCSAEAVPLRGWRRGRRAHIVIPKEVTGDAYNDVGFLRGDTGYTAILSDDHPRFGRRWLARITDRYQHHWKARQERLEEAERQRVEAERQRLVEAQRTAVYARARKLGYRVRESKQGQTVRLVLVKRTY